MVGHGGSSAGLYLADPTSPIPSHCASIVATSTLRVKEGMDDINRMVSVKGTQSIEATDCSDLYQNNKKSSIVKEVLFESVTDAFLFLDILYLV